VVVDRALGVFLGALMLAEVQKVGGNDLIDKLFFAKRREVADVTFLSLIDFAGRFLVRSEAK